MTPLVLAMALLCSWSAPHCQALRSVPVSQGQTAPTVLAQTTFRGSRAVQVVVSDRLTHPVAIGAVLAHEATEIQEGAPKRGIDCDGYEGWSGQIGFYAWFTQTFGPPADVPWLDAYTLFESEPGHQPARPC